MESVKDLAAKAAGNWKRFDSFAWFGRPEDSENWAVVYTHNRDSGLLGQSNAAVISKAMEPFTEGDNPDAIAERHSHWACGWVDGYSIRVYGADGEPTAAFALWCELQARLADYPVLDESDYSERESEATYTNLTEAGESVARRHDLELPNGWQSQVMDFFDSSSKYRGALENRDDQGGYPSDDALEAAFVSMGLMEYETADA